MTSDGVVHSLLSVNMEKLHRYPGPSGGLMRIKDGRHLQGDQGLHLKRCHHVVCCQIHQVETGTSTSRPIRGGDSHRLQGLRGFVPEDPGRQQRPGPRKPIDDVVFFCSFN